MIRRICISVLVALPICYGIASAAAAELIPDAAALVNLAGG